MIPGRMEQTNVVEEEQSGFVFVELE